MIFAFNIESHLPSLRSRVHAPLQKNLRIYLTASERNRRKKQMFSELLENKTNSEVEFLFSQLMTIEEKIIKT